MNIAKTISEKYSRLAIYIDAREKLIEIMSNNKTEESFYTGEFTVFRSSDIEKIQGNNLYSPEKVMKKFKSAVKFYRNMKDTEPVYKTELYKYGKLFDTHFDEFDGLEFDMIGRLSFAI